jgi:hypothetical protein
MRKKTRQGILSVQEYVRDISHGSSACGIDGHLFGKT